MRLLKRINFFVTIILSLLCFSVVSIGLFEINQIVDILNRRLLSLEMKNVKQKIQDYYNILYKTHLLNNNNYILSTQELLIRDFKNYKFGDTGNLFVIDKNNEVVFHPDFKRGSVLNDKYIKEMQEKKIGFLTYKYQGKNKFCIFDNFENWSWTISISVNESELYAHRTRYLYIVSITSIIILSIILLITSFFVKGLVKKINDILISVKKFEEGDYEAKFNFIDFDNEIANLQKGINSMIFQRKLIEEELTVFKKLAEASVLGLCMTDLQFKITYLNTSLCNFLDINADKYLGENLKSLYPDEIKIKLTNEILPQVIAKGQWVGELMHIDEETNSIIPTIENFFIIKDEKENLLYIANFITDISEQKHYEEMLSDEKERLAVTLRSIADGVITTDTDGRIVLINNIAELLTGWSQNEATGQYLSTVFKIFDEKTREVCEDPVTKILSTKQNLTINTQSILISREGMIKIVQYSAAPIFVKNNNIIGVVLVFSDVTEMKKMEQEVLKTHKLESLGILAGGIAHDFNNILTIILGNITLAKNMLSDDYDIIEILSDAEKASSHAMSLTQQLLTFSKGGAPIKKLISIKTLIKENVGFVLRGSNVNCDYKIVNDLWNVEIDENQIIEVINNLVINSIQAMPDGGTIEIKADNVVLDDNDVNGLINGEYIKISIKDEGIGIPSSILNKIFDPYFTTKKDGNGLGLAVCYSIMQRHQGLITVESELGAGSIFHLFLPVAKGEIIEKPEVKIENIQGKGAILLMDDEELILKVGTQILKYLGYKVSVAHNGNEALELYKEKFNTPDAFSAIIMDLTIPGGMGGKKLIQLLIEIDPNVKAVVSSGYSNDPVMANYRDYGFKGMVKKPYGIEELGEIMRKVLDEK